MARSRVRRIVALVAAVLMAASCGARVTTDEVRSGQGSTGRAAAASTHAADQGTAGPVAPGANGGDAVVGAAPQASGQGPTQATAAPAPSTGNGGATDVGVTGTQVLLGNVSTLSGPVPGLFAGAVTGAQAVIAYRNSKGGLFGRTFKLLVNDDQFDTGQNRAVTTEQVGKVFATLNSFSLYDDAAIDALRRTGIPDFSVPINEARQHLPTNLSVAPIDMAGGPTGSFEWFKEKFPDAVKAVGTIYGDVPASKAQQMRMQRVAKAVGWNFIYERGYQATETDFTADVIRMRQSGVKAVYLFAADDKSAARIAKAMQQQAFHPQFVMSNYGPDIPTLAGDAVEGWYGYATQTLFASAEEAALNPEVKLFQTWVQKVKPGAKPDLYAAYGWAMGKLLFQAMEMAGPKVTRAGVVAAVRKIGLFSANDMVAPANPGAKVPATCFIVARIQGGAYQRFDPARGFLCRGAYLRS